MWFIDIIWSTGFWFWICLIYYREYLIIDYFDWIICFWKWFWMFLFYYFQIFGGWPPLYVWHLSDTVGGMNVVKNLFATVCLAILWVWKSGVWRLHYLHVCMCVCRTVRWIERRLFSFWSMNLNPTHPFN